jgi:signal transduction histidine kinase
MSNVARHAQATELELRLERVDGQVVLLVRDVSRRLDPPRLRLLRHAVDHELLLF